MEILILKGFKLSTSYLYLDVQFRLVCYGFILPSKEITGF